MKELFEYLELKALTPNGLYTLWCLSNKRKSFLTNVNTHTELRKLINAGLLNKDYSLTNEGFQVLSSVSDMQNVITTPVANTNSMDNIDRYVSIFPKGKLPSGKPARVNKKNLEEAFKWFFNNYTYDWDIILRATWYYVEIYEKNNYKFMRNSQYFIRKQNTDKTWDSELANCCEIIINGDDEPEVSHFSDKVV
jgi:hypothetical protein